ncbi:glycosyltransferase family 4 protein [Cryobacterium cryoconiti]|nr:glycosyltransferase family 4 protein [Cryobacterium cryoconiti]
MRLTVIGLNYRPELTGIAVYTTGLAERLASDRGNSVHVIAGYPHYPEWRVHAGFTGLSRTDESAGVTVKRLRHYIPSRPRLINRLAMEIQFGLRAAFSSWDRPEVLLLVTPALFSAAIVSLRARLVGTRTCIWVQDIYSLGVSESGAGGRIAALALRRVERAVLGSASTIVVIHERFKRYLVAELGIEADRVEVVRNWCHIEDAPGNRVETRRARGWGPDDIIVLHAGNMGMKQGLENVVAASRIAESRGSRVRFVLLGDGNQRPALQAEGGNSHLEFLRPLPEDEFRATLAAADVLLLNERPGLTEMSVPSKLTSYFQSGLPVIAATDRSSITAEELAVAGAGLRVDAAAPDALVEAAERLGLDAKASHAYGVAGRRFAADILGVGPAITRFQAILERLAPRQREERDDRAPIVPPPPVRGF